MRQPGRRIAHEWGFLACYEGTRRPLQGSKAPLRHPVEAVARHYPKATYAHPAAIQGMPSSRHCIAPRASLFLAVEGSNGK
jgi:hypothetical protein